jgi:cytochrome c oxidase subunit 2
MLAQNDVNAEVEDPDVTIETTAFQWGWRFEYQEHDITISGTPEDPPEMVVPVDRNLSFILRASDVDHAFYIPRFLIKRDVIPGKTNQLDLSIEEPGVYEGLCAEFCGLLHDRMTFTVRAVSPSEFEDLSQEEQADV